MIVVQTWFNPDQAIKNFRKKKGRVAEIGGGGWLGEIGLATKLALGVFWPYPNGWLRGLCAENGHIEMTVWWQQIRTRFLLFLLQ